MLQDIFFPIRHSMIFKRLFIPAPYNICVRVANCENTIRAKRRASPPTLHSLQCIRRANACPRRHRHQPSAFMPTTKIFLIVYLLSIKRHCIWSYGCMYMCAAYICSKVSPQSGHGCSWL